MKKMNKIGDKKTLKKFAWFPIVIKGEIVWLKTYSKIYEFQSVERYWKFATQVRGKFYKYNDWELIEKIK